MTAPDPTAVGVIVGRFQVPELHDGHRALIDHVLARHNRVIIVVGDDPLPTSKKNPLPAWYRVDRLQETYLAHIHQGSLYVTTLEDRRSDHDWSDDLDDLIDSVAVNVFDLEPHDLRFVLYGSRDSFISYYHGEYPTEFVAETADFEPATVIRERIAYDIDRPTPTGFAEGVIWATHQAFPTVYSTVDVIIRHHDGTQPYFLLGRKPRAKEWCLIGGFADPTSGSDEEDAIREVQEETGLQIPVGKLEYIGNFPIDDWRYRSSQDTIRTRLYAATADYPLQAKADDDIEEIAWFAIDEVRDKLQECHIPLWDAYLVWQERTGYGN